MARTPNSKIEAIKNTHAVVLSMKKEASLSNETVGPCCNVSPEFVSLPKRVLHKLKQFYNDINVTIYRVGHKNRPLYYSL